MKPLLTLLLTYVLQTTIAQQHSVHIVTIPGNLVAPFKFNFTVNGIAYKLKAGQCIELTTKADSVHIVLNDNRWVKNETIDLHTAAVKDLYALIKLARNKQIMKGELYMAEIICKECFDTLKKKCTKEIMESME
jgi:hypothetical protein